MRPGRAYQVARRTETCAPTCATYAGGVGTLFRYLLISGVVLGLAVSAFVVRIQGRTAYGHLRQLSQGRFDSVLAEIQSGLDERLAQFREIVDDTRKKRPQSPKKSAPAKTRPSPNEKQREAGVEKLRQASAKTSARPGGLAEKKATRIEDAASPAEEKALDRLLTNRISR